MDRRREDVSAGQPGRGIAPADTVVHPRWPRWKVVLAYAVLFALGLAAIWFIDRRVWK